MMARRLNMVPLRASWHSAPGVARDAGQESNDIREADASRKARPAAAGSRAVDARQGITHVVRGRDLFWSTSVHRLLQALLELPAPVYHHHRLVLDPDGRKLSKSTKATALRSLRHDGITAAAVRRMVGLQ